MNAALPSIFSNIIRDKHGRIKRPMTHRSNLRTTAGIDWQAQVMGKITAQPLGAGYLALTSDATAPNVADTVLTAELATLGFSRIAGTYAHTAGTNTFTMSNTFTATGGATINKEAMFNAAAAGTMIFESAEPSPPTLISGDTLAQTVTITYSRRPVDDAIISGEVSPRSTRCHNGHNDRQSDAFRF